MLRTISLFVVLLLPTTVFASVINTLGIQGPAGSSVTVHSNGWDTDSSGFVPVFDGDFLRSRAPRSNLTVTFNNLGAHDSLDIDLLVAQMESLDPVRDGDTFDIYLDGVQLLRVGLGFGASGSFFDPVVSNYLTNNGTPDDEQKVLNTNIWTRSGGFADHAYDFGQLEVLQGIAHTSSSATITIIGRSNQGWSNEAYGIDNLSLTVHSVPAPAGALLLLLGLVCLPLSRRR